MQKNSLYNDYLNSANIILGMSGGEGWGLPEFQSVALGKHAVILNATGYKDWATEKIRSWLSLAEKERYTMESSLTKDSPLTKVAHSHSMTMNLLTLAKKLLKNINLTP